MIHEKGGTIILKTTWFVFPSEDQSDHGTTSKEREELQKNYAEMVLSLYQEHYRVLLPISVMNISS